MSPYDWFLSQSARKLRGTVLCFDIETTGFLKDRDLVWEVGYALVKGGRVVDHGHHVVNWFGWPGLFDVDARIEKVCSHMREAGKPFNLSAGRLRAEGLPPPVVFTHYYELFHEVEFHGGAIAAHRGLVFDVPFMQQTFGRVLEKTWTPGDCVLDTQALERAKHFQIPPLRGESVNDYSARLCRVRKPGGALEDCAKRYGWEDKHGYDPRKAHSAGQDAIALAWLIDEHRPALDALAPEGAVAPAGKPATQGELFGEGGVHELRRESVADLRGEGHGRPGPKPRPRTRPGYPRQQNGFY